MLTAAVCLIPSNDDHGLTITTDGGYVGSMLTVECKEGYWFTGTTPRTCQTDGQWSGVPGYCKGRLSVSVSVSFQASVAFDQSR